MTEMVDAEGALARPIPEDLADLLQFSNGLFDVTSQHEFVWPLDRLVEDNQRSWASTDLPLPTSLFAFGDDGAGDWFCLPLADRPPGIYHWGWNEGEARLVAPDLQTFLPRWLDGDLEV
jgi:hypothetical protein